GAGAAVSGSGGLGKRNRETSVGAATASGSGTGSRSGSGSGAAVSSSGSGSGSGSGSATASGSGSGSGSGSAKSPKPVAEGKKSSGEVGKGAADGKDGKGGKGASKTGGGSASSAAAAVRSPDSKYLGVRKQEQGSRWVAYIIRPSVGGETNLGVFDEEVDAAKQYDKYANAAAAAAATTAGGGSGKNPPARTAAAAAAASGSGGARKKKKEERDGMDVEEGVDKVESKVEDEEEEVELLDGVLLVQYLWARGRAGFGGGGVSAFQPAPSSGGSRRRSSPSADGGSNAHPATDGKKHDPKVEADDRQEKSGGGGVANVDSPHPAASGAGLSLTPAVSRGLRRGYLAQTLARIVGVAGVVRDARRAGHGGDRTTIPGGSGSPSAGPPSERSFPRQSGGVVGAGGGGQQPAKEGGGGWGGAQEQATAAVEALGGLDRGVEELLDEADEKEQVADLAQLELIASKALSSKSAQALKTALGSEREAAVANKAAVSQGKERLQLLKEERQKLKAALSDKEREAVATSGQQGFLQEQAAMLEGVRGEWAALRSALRRRVGAARTLLLTDGTCRLHAVPEDRLEQPRRMDEAWRALLFLEKVYPNETVLKRSVDPAWVEMVTPETMLMLAHSRAYVDQLRTRVDEAGSSVECLTAVDGSEDDLGGLGGGERG
ncbi:unnamed protein product, partial [Ectocarpus fasciculatus]